jgi:Ni2+-binding GTPase involved in maturation of urease and hydrogenase
MIFHLLHPFTAMVAGMTGSGKTVWVMNFLEHAAKVIKPGPLQRIVCCYSQWLDDQMSETSRDKRIMNLFTKGSHHRNLSVIFLLQNLFYQRKITRTMSLNTQYLVLFKNPRGKLQILTLGKQIISREYRTIYSKI